MKKRNVRWLLASIVAVVSLGAGVSVTATADDAPAEDESSLRYRPGKEREAGKPDSGKKSGGARSFGIRW